MTIEYSFDTSVLINGRRDLLPPDVFGTPWLNVEADIASGLVRAVDVVRDEVSRRDDEAKNWARAQQGLFVPLSTEIQQAASQVLAQHEKLMGRGGGRNAADPFVIALAIVCGATVVTEETASNNLDKPRIPDVCSAMGVRCTNLVGYHALRGHTY